MNPLNGLTMQDLRAKTAYKTEKLRAKGHRVIEMWECEFMKQVWGNHANAFIYNTLVFRVAFLQFVYIRIVLSGFRRQTTQGVLPGTSRVSFY